MWLIIAGGILLYGLGLFITIGLNEGFSWMLLIDSIIGGFIVVLFWGFGEWLGQKWNKKNKEQLGESKDAKSNKFFITIKEKKGTGYFEFQYCKKELSIKNLINNNEHWKEDSLFVDANSDLNFFENYGFCLYYINPQNQTNQFCEYGVNYYTKEQTKIILDKIEEVKPKDYEIIVAWLEKAINEYNGFYFMGI